jgi:hypothetical protein
MAVVGRRMSWLRVITTFLLFLGGIVCIGLGVKPFIEGLYETRDIANIGFMVLIVFLMIGFFGTGGTTRYIFWVGCFTLVIYANMIFMYHEILFI